MKKISVFILSFLFGIQLSHSQTPTWSGNVASIIYNNCSNCHHAGGIGPFTLMSYQDAVDNAVNIQSYVSAKKMPPWMPDPNYVHFKDERILSDDDINTIVDWVDAGVPAGDTTQAPTAPVFPTGSQMASIDQTIQWPKWTISSDIDEYRTFVIHSNYAQDVYLNQIEYLPGNGSVVHHMVLFYDTGPWSWTFDQNDPLPGYESYGLGPVSFTATILGAWAPGSGIFELPSNMGIRIPAGADIGLEIHYSPGENGQIDSSSLNFKFTTYPSPREVYMAGVLNHLSNLTDGPLFIPANTVKTFHEKYKLTNQDGPVSLVSVFPHMHKVGTSIKSFAVTDGGDTTKLVSIPKWSFHWQGFYEYQKLIHITTLSTFWGEATYDNTIYNLDNPNNPPEDVSSGEHTTDEMMIVFFAFLAYQPGDEDIILDSTVVSVPPIVQQQNLPMHVFPNPVLDELNVGTELQKATDLSFSLVNEEGQIAKVWNKTISGGVQATSFSLKGLPSGIYFLKATSAEGYAVTKVIKQ
ncbi:MAG TPA: T9SS type A sorting domain-containing protein [Chitinophagales bacterium]|nr:T9SS type A sorting domain-containing protein [Chitinophagales bacterium]